MHHERRGLNTNESMDVTYGRIHSLRKITCTWGAGDIVMNISSGGGKPAFLTCECC